jgi:hypothetical protein
MNYTTNAAATVFAAAAPRAYVDVDMRAVVHIPKSTCSKSIMWTSESSHEVAERFLRRIMHISQSSLAMLELDAVERAGDRLRSAPRSRVQIPAATCSGSTIYATERAIRPPVI